MNMFLVCILLGLHALVQDAELLTLTVPKIQEVATLGTDQFTLSCSYNTDPGETFLYIELLRKRSGETESSIVTFTKDANATYSDASLMTRTSTDWPTAGRTANLVFSSIMCADKAEYIWRATYLSNLVKYSNQTVNVLVKAITTFNQTAGQITYSPSVNVAEGDEVEFKCSGDVGNEPVGHLGWYYYLRSDPTVPLNVSSRAVATLPVYQPSTCSFTRSSTLKLVMTKEFNQFLVRCTVQQSKYDQVGEGHRQTSNINVSYAPRINPLNFVPVKTEGDSVTLNCNADANPSPAYYWMLPNSDIRPGSQLQIANLTVNDTGVYTCVAYNTYKNENHTSNTSVSIDVRLSTHPPTKKPQITTVGTGVKNPEITTVETGNQSESTEQSHFNEQDAKASQSSVATIVGPIMGSLGAVVLTAVVLFIIYHRRKKLKAQKRGGNSAGVGTTVSRSDFNMPGNEGTDNTYNTLEGRETEHSYSVIENRGMDRVYMNSLESSQTGRTYNTLKSSGTEHTYNTLETSGTEYTYNTLEGSAKNHIYNTLENKGTEHTYSMLKN